MQAAYGGEQVGAEGDIRPASALEHAEHLDEGVGNEVVGLDGSRQLPGQATGGDGVAFE